MESMSTYRSREVRDLGISLALLHETDVAGECGTFFLVEDVGRHGEELLRMYELGSLV